MPKKSLVYIVTQGSILLVLCAFIVSFGVNYWHLLNLTNRSHSEQLQQHLTLLSHNLEAPLWTLDRATIKLVANTYMSGNDVVSLKIVSKDYKEPIYFSEKSANSITYGKTAIVHKNYPLGFIEIGLSKKAYKETLENQAIFSLLLVVLSVVFLLFFTSRLIKEHLAKPLMLLSTWTDSFASGNYDIPTPNTNLYELSPLVDKFSEMANEIKQRENELIAYKNNLQELVDERTLELKKAHSELLQKERLATLGQLTATVSHELRNPLGTIKTSLFSIEDRLEMNCAQNVNRSLELADRSINRCVKIIEELNYYARTKKLNYSVTLVDEWLRDLVDEMEMPDWIQVEFHLNCGITVFFDQDKTRQVIINLISNAIDALNDKPSKEAILTISTHLKGDKYEISISDTGSGISEETKEKIFEPLFSTKGFGIGLGMVIVKDIIEQHQGQILIRSQEGSGTTITLEMPVNRPDKQ